MSALPPVGALPPPELPADLPPLAAAATAVGRHGAAVDAGFGAMVSQGLEQVNAALKASQGDLQRLATGEVQNLHQVMIGLEEAKLSFQLMMQVRNRLLEAYQDVMKMQI